MKTLPDAPPVLVAHDDESQIEENFLFDARGVTPRVVCLSLLLAAFFGLVIPIIDVKMSNTYLGAQHLPVGALAALMILLLVVNPLLRVLARRFVLRRNELLTVTLPVYFPVWCPVTARKIILCRIHSAAFITPTSKTAGSKS
jgi:hypothetical protein